jgi:hypothetical protein
MRFRLLVHVALIASYCVFVAAADTPSPASPSTHELTMGTIAKIQVGSTNHEQLKALWGTPLRTLNYGDCNPIDYQEVWEYLGRDANGIFRISVQFDDEGVARILTKTPAKGPAVLLAIAPKPASKHIH